MVDQRNTAGYGAGTVIALVTQAPEGRQAQYLWYSTDRGRSFQAGGPAPVLPNPGVNDFRDPKVIWDAYCDRWFMVNAEGQKLGFYASPDLRSWQRVGEFQRNYLGVLECPDISRITADDGTSHWVLGTSANGKGRGLPATYAYWTGAFDGSSFTPYRPEPEWLDYGFDFYGAVTYPIFFTTARLALSVDGRHPPVPERILLSSTEIGGFRRLLQTTPFWSMKHA